jgi:putative lipoic acid-binding regulatory protein
MVHERDAFYSKLKLQLEDTSKFPSDYMYKFIVPTTENQVQEVRDVFEKVPAIIKIKKSKTGKYESLSVVLKVQNSSEIIYYYRQAEKIKGIVSL